MLFCLNLQVQIVVGEGERFSIKRKTIHHRGTEDKEETETLADRF
jgi:hypothetical protein